MYAAGIVLEPVVTIMSGRTMDPSREGDAA
jgi:hypothetical protein